MKKREAFDKLRPNGGWTSLFDRRLIAIFRVMPDTQLIDRDDAVVGRHGAIKLHGPEGFAGMRAAGRCAAEILDDLVPHVVPGVTTQELDDIVAAPFPPPWAIAAIPGAAAPRSTMSSATASPASGR